MRPFHAWSLVLVTCIISMYMFSLAGATDASTGTTDDSSVVPTARLSNGLVIPLVGLGCASGVRKSHVLSALEAGYRYLDTAQAYQWGYHERDVAAAIAESPFVERQDVFVVTKIHPENLGVTSTRRAIEGSLQQAGFGGYLDGILIHKPRCWPGACSKDPEGTWQESWKVLEEYYDKGLVKAIGICDVDNERMLDELMQQRIPPHIIQNWFDPFHQTHDIRQAIQAKGILFQAYSTLGTQWKHFRGLDQNPVLTSTTLTDMAHRHGVPGPAQVVIQWAVNKYGISVLPASTNPQRQADNLHASFSFVPMNEQDFEVLDQMDGTAPAPSRPDPNQVAMTFTTTTRRQEEEVVQAFWVDEDGQEVPVGTIEANRELNMNSYHGHAFVFRSSAGKLLLEHTVSRNGGRKQTVVVGDGDNDEEEL